MRLSAPAGFVTGVVRTMSARHLLTAVMIAVAGPGALLACAMPAKDDVVRDGAAAISRVVKACPELKLTHENWRTEFSEGDWYVWDGIPECHFSSAHVHASDGVVSRCQILACSG